MKVVYEFDPFDLVGVEPPKSKSKRDEALAEIADYVKLETLNYAADGRTPVSGGKWKRSLSADYKDIKKAAGGTDYADMNLEGDMLDSFDVTQKGKKLQAGWNGGAEADKADGHNNFSGKSELPARESVPNSKKGQTYKREILKGIKQIAEDFSDAED